MLVDINKVIVGERIRKDLGNLDELAEDIKANGLINPPVVTPNYELIAGERRLEAMKKLGYNQIEVRVMNVEDAEHMLNLEINENENRKDFTKSERIDYARQLEKIERMKANERMRTGKKIDPTQNFEKGETDDKVAKELGIGSGEQYRKEKFIADNADDETLKKWNKEEISTHKAYMKVKEELDEQKSINTSLATELEKERNKEPEIIEKEVIKEIVPDDYEQIKEQIKKLQSDNDDLKNKLVIEKNKKQQAIGQLEEEQQKEKIIKEINSFAWTINGFIKDVGGLIYLTDYIDEVPKASRDLFISTAKTLKDWANQLDYNIQKRKED